MAKRFTDDKKWRNEWFRTLPDRAKLTWVYMCDECESHGVIKMDYGLAKFQLGFPIDPEKIRTWFGDKIHFIDDEKILILSFYEFQYGSSKDSWSAKVKAREKLESPGLVFEKTAPSEIGLYRVGVHNITKGILYRRLTNTLPSPQEAAAISDQMIPDEVTMKVTESKEKKQMYIWSSARQSINGTGR